MPTLATPSSQHAIVWDIRSPADDASCGNGEEARRLSRLAEEAKQHWLETAGMLLALVESDAPAYEHVLPEPHSVVKVRYKFVGRMEPRRFSIHD